MSAERVVYSIQKTYILNVVSTSGEPIVTCDQRIDIPTIEPLTGIKPVVYQPEFTKIIPCIELACVSESEFFSGLKFVFETNEGVTVLPIMIDPGRDNSLENPYVHPRYVLVLPRGATGIKSCKVFQNRGGIIQHNLTFGIMPPPYNYDNALFSYLSSQVMNALSIIMTLYEEVTNLNARVTALENKAGG